MQAAYVASAATGDASVAGQQRRAPPASRGDRTAACGSGARARGPPARQWAVPGGFETGARRSIVRERAPCVVVERDAAPTKPRRAGRGKACPRR